MSPNIDNWSKQFDEAAEAYVKALHHGAIGSSTERKEAAKRFRDHIISFRLAEKSVLTILDKELKSEDIYRCHVAARLLIEMRETATLSLLSEKIIESGRPQLNSDDLRRIWIETPPPRGTLERFFSEDRWEQIALVEALLDRPTEAAYSLFDEVMRRGNLGVADAAATRVARWGDNKQLSRIVSSLPVHYPSPVDWWAMDVRLTAALYLGLSGDTDGIRYLVSIAAGNQLTQAAYACEQLALLALPEAIKFVVPLLNSDDPNVVAITLRAAGIMRATALIPALIDVGKRRSFTEMYPIPICDEAIRTLRSIIGGQLNNLDEEYVGLGGAIPEEFTEDYRQNALAHSRVALHAMDLKRRYNSGKPLTLQHLAEELLSPHSAIRYSAACNLRAITGEDYGFDPSADLIANLPAIEAWEKRTTDPAPLSPGGWAFMGTPLNPPISNEAESF